jgi:hypothetical protein
MNDNRSTQRSMPWILDQFPAKLNQDIEIRPSGEHRSDIAVSLCFFGWLFLLLSG